MSDQIKGEYQYAYNLEVERTSGDLYKILTLVDESGARSPLPGQFFYGIDDWKTCETLAEAAIKASAPIVVERLTIDRVPKRSSTKEISPKAVIAIYEFLKYPKDYNDPLDLVGEWGENWEDHLLDDQGARRYVSHKKQYFVVDGRLHEIKKWEENGG